MVISQVNLKFYPIGFPDIGLFNSSFDRQTFDFMTVHFMLLSIIYVVLKFSVLKLTVYFDRYRYFGFRSFTIPEYGQSGEQFYIKKWGVL